MNFLNFSQDHFRLRQFYYVAKAGSLSGAGKILGVGHTTLSESMKILEYRLKTKVLVREGKGMKLTADGERLFEFAEKLFTESEEFLNTFSEKGEELQGQIKIITTAAIGETIITYSLLPFLEKHPNLKIDIQTTVDDFDLHDADVAIRPLLPHREDVNQLPLFTFHLKLWASKEYLEKYGTPQTVKDLDNHRILSFKQPKVNLYFDNKQEINWILNVGNENNIPRRAFYHIRSHEGIHLAACKGYGIAQLPAEYVKIKNSSVIEVLPNLAKPTVETYFIFRKNPKKSKRIEALYLFLKESFEEALS